MTLRINVNEIKNLLERTPKTLASPGYIRQLEITSFAGEDITEFPEEHIVMALGSTIEPLQLDVYGTTNLPAVVALDVYKASPESIRNALEKGDLNLLEWQKHATLNALSIKTWMASIKLPAYYETSLLGIVHAMGLYVIQARPRLGNARSSQWSISYHTITETVTV